MEVTPMLRNRLTIPFLILTLTLVSGMLARAGAPAPGTPTRAAAERVKRGEYLVGFGGCNDCHTPWKVGPNGPEMDMTRALTGHPEGLVMPPAPALPPGPWQTTAG